MLRSLAPALASVLWYFIPLLVLSVIWMPDFLHYHVSNTSIATSLVNSSRTEPATPILVELDQMILDSYRPIRDRESVIRVAEAMLAGELRAPPYPPQRFNVSFDASSLRHLSFATFIVPDVLLNAYLFTQEERFYLAAKKYILAFAEYERSTWRPKGFLWNDHAVAARVPIVIRFWRIYRQRTDFDMTEASAVILLLARSGQFLAKPTHFTYRTNHGIMQNVGLLQLCVAFPGLADAAHWCQVAVQRLHDQLKFYVIHDGVVLEHSAGYQVFGTQLLSMIFRALTLLNRPVPEEWAYKYQKAREYYAALRRPDYTLPMYGDTESVPKHFLVTERDNDGRFTALQLMSGSQPPNSFNLFPLGGSVIWWKGLDAWPQTHGLSQTVVTWGDSPGRAHKHADEMSVILWRDGQTWITNAGYWPTTHWGRAHAEGWAGSNAPHLAGEPANSSRITDLLGYVDDDQVTLVDLRRRGPAGYTARRQVIQLGSRGWLVLDHVKDTMPRRNTIIWTLDSAVRATSLGMDHGYRLVSENSAMTVFLLGSQGTEVSTYSGSRDPFAGWVTIDTVPTPAVAFAVNQPSTDSYLFSLWSPEAISGSQTAAAPLQLLQWRDSENWSVRIDTLQQAAILERAGRDLLLRKGDGNDSLRIAIAQRPDTTAAWAAVVSSYEQVKAKSRKFREVAPYRLKVTYLLLAVFVCQEILLWLFRSLPRSYLLAARIGLSAAWLLGGAWLHFVYFGA